MEWNHFNSFWRSLWSCNHPLFVYFSIITTIDGGCWDREWGLFWGTTASSQHTAQPGGQAWTETKRQTYGRLGGRRGDSGQKVGRMTTRGASEGPRATEPGSPSPAEPANPPSRWESDVSDELVAASCQFYFKLATKELLLWKPVLRFRL